MTKQEAISREEAVRTISRIFGGSVSYAEDLYDSFFPKPVVPQYVAEWYEANKDEFEINLFQTIHKVSDGQTVDLTIEFGRWLVSVDIDALTILVNMHQFGYEVEKEAKYEVRIKGRLGQYLGKYYLNNEELTPQFIRTLKGEGSVFTRTELETSGFGWVFDCEGVEVKEVTDGND